MEEVGVILPLVQTIERVTCFINHLLFTMLHLEEQSQRDRYLLPVFLATSDVGVEDKCKETLQSAYILDCISGKRTSSIKRKKNRTVDRAVVEVLAGNILFCLSSC